MCRVQSATFPKAHMVSVQIPTQDSGRRFKLLFEPDTVRVPVKSARHQANAPALALSGHAAETAIPQLLI
jgi:hypothetical protein